MDLFWIEGPGPGRLAVMPRPEGGEDLEQEVRDLRREGVDVVVSLLEEHEIDEQDLLHEGGLVEGAGMEFLTLPIPDHTPPVADEPTARLIRGLVSRYRKGKKIAVHCLGGLGRSPSIAASVLLEVGVPVETVFERLRKARGFPVPEMPEQIAWILNYARGRLGC